MVEKMKYVYIMGDIGDFDRVIEQYISRYDIQLEHTPQELAETKGVFAFNAVNPYTEPLRKAQALIEQTGLSVASAFDIPKERALEVIDKAFSRAQVQDAGLQETQQRILHYQNFIEVFGPFSRLDCCIEDLEKIKFIKYRFGRMPYRSYKQFQTLLFANSNMLFVESQRIGDYMYGICFVTHYYNSEADSLLSSFHFERIHVPYELDGEKLEGAMYHIYQEALLDLDDLKEDISSLMERRFAGISVTPLELVSAYNKIREMQFYYETRKFAAKTRKNFYIFVGWMSAADAGELKHELDLDDHVVFAMDDGSEARTSSAPTKLKNHWPFRPFEMFVKMYGLPAYNELDPTIFITLTYTLLFGMMFGDVGQGAVLSLAGFLLYRAKGWKLGAIVSVIGLSSVFFGFMYGSVFGMEHWLPGFWMKPSENINVILLVSVSLGILLVMTAMVINIINAALQKDWSKLLFSPNGVAGAVFYSSVIYMILMGVSGSVRFMNVAVVAAVLTICFLAFREPIAKLLRGEKKLIHGNIILFLFEAVIELFEVLLSYFTNTVSFVRVGAFALSHAGIMGVVCMLSETGRGSYSLWGLIIGNIIVICMEGLVVGIQALRLDFYEMFSRFYEGGGKAFVPYNAPKP